MKILSLEYAVTKFIPAGVLLYERIYCSSMRSNAIQPLGIKQDMKCKIIHMSDGDGDIFTACIIVINHASNMPVKKLVMARHHIEDNHNIHSL